MNSGRSDFIVSIFLEFSCILAYNELGLGASHCIYNEFGPEKSVIGLGGGVENSLFIVRLW